MDHLSHSNILYMRQRLIRIEPNLIIYLPAMRVPMLILQVGLGSALEG
jgi:hypothetical protein